MDGVLMRRKGLEWRSKKYAPVQNVSVVNGYMDAEDFRQKYKTGRVGVKKRMSPAAGGQNHIMIYGPKSDGTYVVEFKTATGEALAMSVPRRETAVLKHFQERMSVWAMRAGNPLRRLLYLNLRGQRLKITLR